MQNPKDILKQQIQSVVWGNILAVEPVIETWFLCAKASGVSEEVIKEALEENKDKKHLSMNKCLDKFKGKLDEKAKA